jgi:hypothetical protein
VEDTLPPGRTRVDVRGIAAVTLLAPEVRIGAGAGVFVMVATGVITGRRFFRTDPGFPNLGGGRRAAVDRKSNSPAAGSISGLPVAIHGMTGHRGDRESEVA